MLAPFRSPRLGAGCDFDASSVPSGRLPAARACAVLAILILVALHQAALGSSGQDPKRSTAAAAPGGAPQSPQTVWDDRWGPYAPDQVFVGFRPGATASLREQAMASLGAAMIEDDPAIGFTRLKLPPGMPVREAVEALASHPAILWAEPVVYYHSDICPRCPQDPLLIPSDPWAQWGIFNTGVYSLWRQGSGLGTVIAIVDTGIDDFSNAHPDLRDNILPIGYDAVAPTDNDPTDETGIPPNPMYGHGTQVAGVAAAVSDAAGIAGVAYCSKILVVRVLDCRAPPPRCTTDGLRLARGIEWAAGANVGVGDGIVDVINLSLGAPPAAIPLNQRRAVERAIRYARQRGAIVVAAAGNDTLASVEHPACLNDLVIAVGASNILGQVSAFSNWGPQLDVVAPGEDILSTRAGGGHIHDSGTSFATPFVSGLAAIYKGRHADQGLGFLDFQGYITSHVREIPDTARDGRGRVDFQQLEDWSDAHKAGAAPDYSRVSHGNFLWEWLGSDATAELGTADPRDEDGRPNIGGTHDTDGSDDGVFPGSHDRLPYRPPHIPGPPQQWVDVVEQVCRRDGPRYAAAPDHSLHLDMWMDWDGNRVFETADNEHVVIDHRENPQTWPANTQTLTLPVVPRDSHHAGPLAVRTRLNYRYPTPSADTDSVVYGEVEDDQVLNFYETFDIGFYEPGDAVYATLEPNWLIMEDELPYPHHEQWNYAFAGNNCLPVSERLILPAATADPLDLRELTQCHMQMWLMHSSFACWECTVPGPDRCRVAIRRYDANQVPQGETVLFEIPYELDPACGGPGPWSSLRPFDLSAYVGGYIRIVVYHDVNGFFDMLWVDDVVVWGFDGRESPAVTDLRVERVRQGSDLLNISFTSQDENGAGPPANRQANAYHIRYASRPILGLPDWEWAMPIRPPDAAPGFAYPVPSLPGALESATFRVESRRLPFYAAVRVDDEVVNVSALCAGLYRDCPAIGDSRQPAFAVGLSALGNAVAAPGDTTFLSFLLTNAGQMDDGFSVDAVGSRSWSLDHELYQIVEAEGGARASDTVRVRVAVPATAIPGQVDSVAVAAASLTDTTVSATATAAVVVEGAPCAHLADHAGGNVRLSVTDQGILGFTSDIGGEGSGFVYPRTGGANRLYIGGFTAATDTSFVLNRDYSYDPVQDWAPAACLEPGPAGEWAESWSGVYSDAGHPAPRGLEVRQRSLAWADAANDDYVIIVYEVVNGGTQVISDLRLGCNMDWDLNPAVGFDQNSGATDADRRLIYMWRDGGGDGVYAGVKALAPRTQPQMNFVHNETYVYPLHYLRDADRYHFLSGDDPEYVVPATTAPSDWSAMLGLGPWVLAPGDTGWAAVAVLAGESLAALLANADAAQLKFDAIWGTALAVEPPPAAPASSLRLALDAGRPNPFGAQTMLGFVLPGGGPASLTIYDAAGRHVATLVDGALAPGRHTAVWDGRDGSGRAAASGVYYVRLEVAGEMRTKKLLKFR